MSIPFMTMMNGSQAKAVFVNGEEVRELWQNGEMVYRKPVLMTFSRAYNGGSGSINVWLGSNSSGTQIGSGYSVSFYAAPGTTIYVSANTGSGNGFGSWSDGGAQSHAITVPSIDASYIATFTATLTVANVSGSSSGSVQIGSGASSTASVSQTVNVGTALTATASPTSGRSFYSWSDGLGNGASRTVTTSTTINATFGATITVSTSPTNTNGRVRINSGGWTTSASQTFPLNSSGTTGNVTLEASSSGSTGNGKFSSWSTGSGSSYITVNVSSNSSYTAYFICW